MKQFATFYLDKQLFGVEVILVREINQQLEITPVPQSIDYVCGFINLRGQIVTILDLGVRLGLQPREINANSHIVILKTEEELGPIRVLQDREDLKTCDDLVGLLVDSIGDVVEADSVELEPQPPNMANVDSRYLSAVHNLQNEVLIILNLQAVVDKESDS